MSWIIATIIILVVLLIFIYISSLLAQKTKVIKAESLQISDTGYDFLNAKTNLTYDASSEQNKMIIDDWRKKNG